MIKKLPEEYVGYDAMDKLKDKIDEIIDAVNILEQHRHDGHRLKSNGEQSYYCTSTPVYHTDDKSLKSMCERMAELEKERTKEVLEELKNTPPDRTYILSRSQENITLEPENVDISCPHCGAEFVTSAEGNAIVKCPACDKAVGKKEQPKDSSVPEPKECEHEWGEQIVFDINHNKSIWMRCNKCFKTKPKDQPEDRSPLTPYGELLAVIQECYELAREDYLTYQDLVVMRNNILKKLRPYVEGK